jgi:hypothetical protein
MTDDPLKRVDPVALLNSVVRRHESENRSEKEWMKRIAENPEDPELTIADLAEITGYSQRHLVRLVEFAQIGKFDRANKNRLLVKWSELVSLLEEMAKK